MNDILFSSQTDDWKTPSNIFNLFMNCGYLDLFPFCSQYDQMEIHPSTYLNKKCFINPPYSKLRDKDFSFYIEQIFKISKRCFLLIPSRTDTYYFERFYRQCDLIIFVQGRLKFNDSKSVAPFPSIFMCKTGLYPYVKTVICPVEQLVRCLSIYINK